MAATRTRGGLQICHELKDAAPTEGHTESERAEPDGRIPDERTTQAHLEHKTNHGRINDTDRTSGHLEPLTRTHQS